MQTCIIKLGRASVCDYKQKRLSFEASIGNCTLNGDFKFHEDIQISSRKFKDSLIEYIGSCFKRDMKQYKVKFEMPDGAAKSK